MDHLKFTFPGSPARVIAGGKPMRRVLGSVPLLMLAIGVLGFGQQEPVPDLGTQFPGTVRPQRPAPPARPAPRLASGRVSLGPLPGEAGLWLPGPGGTPGEPWP